MSEVSTSKVRTVDTGPATGTAPAPLPGGALRFLLVLPALVGVLLIAPHWNDGQWWLGGILWIAVAGLLWESTVLRVLDWYGRRPRTRRGRSR